MVLEFLKFELICLVMAFEMNCFYLPLSETYNRLQEAKSSFRISKPKIFDGDWKQVGL